MAQHRGEDKPTLAQRKPSLPKLERQGDESARGIVRKKLFYRFFAYLADYGTTVLDKVLPSKFREATRLFLSGSRALFLDMREFIGVYNVLSATSDWDKACRTLTRRQLMLYRTLPDELYSVAPVLLLSAFPLMQNVVFPLAMLYPKQLLCSHFWSPEMRREVMAEQQKKKHR